MRTWEAAGAYRSTEDGAAAYNDGAVFDVSVVLGAKVGRSGSVYVLITESAPDVISAVTGPHLARTLPAVDGSTYPLEIARIDGDGRVTPIREGTILW